MEHSAGSQDQPILTPRRPRRSPRWRYRTIHGIPLAEAGAVFFPVSRTRPLPDGYVPPDLVYDLGCPIRALVAGDLVAMFRASQYGGIDLLLVSGFRSAEQQAVIFEQQVEHQLCRDEAIDRREAQRRAGCVVAPPGCSQHQLGTTVDLSSPECGGELAVTFDETAASRWLKQHAHEYGFIMPYTAAAAARTGYIAEPWHYRWVGRLLATHLWKRGYLTDAVDAVDDILLALEPWWMRGQDNKLGAMKEQGRKAAGLGAARLCAKVT